MLYGTHEQLRGTRTFALCAKPNQMRRERDAMDPVGHAASLAFAEYLAQLQVGPIACLSNVRAV